MSSWLANLGEGLSSGAASGCSHMCLTVFVPLSTAVVLRLPMSLRYQGPFFLSITPVLFFHGIFLSAFMKSPLYMGFGGGCGAAPAGLNRGGGVRSFRASRDRFLTTLL